MAQYKSAESSVNWLYRETLAGSNTYERIEQYIPTVFTFDINPDTLTFSNISIVSLGTPIFAHEGENVGRSEFIATSNSDDEYAITPYYTYNITYGQGYNISFGYLSNGNVIGDLFSSYGGHYKTTKTNGNFYLGFYYNKDVNRYWVFSATRKYTSSNFDIQYKEVAQYKGITYYEQLKTFIFDTFYGGVDVPAYRLELIEPTDTYFDIGQTKTIKVYLIDKQNNTVSTNVNLNLYDGAPAWRLANNELTLLTTPTENGDIQATITYQDVEYEKFYTFRVRATNTPYNPGGLSSSLGGGGAFGNGTFGRPENSSPVGNDVPRGSVEGDMSTTGFMTRYLCSSATLGIFGEWLWSDEFGLTVAKGVISLIFGSPAESVISLMSYPFDISRMSGINTHQQNIFWGHVNSLIASTALDSQSCYIDWGTIQLDEYWGNFLDYSPHTKIELYLPWGPGFVSIDPGQVLPGSIKVITNIDLMKGSCIHNVIGYSNTGNVSNNVMIGSYSGQCGKQIPVISNDSASKAVGVVVGAVSAAVAPVIGAAAGAGLDALGAAKGTKGITTGHIPSPTGGFINAGVGKYSRSFQILDAAAEGLSKGLSSGNRVGGKIATTSLAIARSPMSVSRNGGFTDGSSSLSIQYPYLIVSRPIQSVADNYGSLYGYPSNIYTRLSNLKGYTEVGEIHLENIPATVTELEELDKLLKGGVIF